MRLRVVTVLNSVMSETEPPERKKNTFLDRIRLDSAMILAAMFWLVLVGYVTIVIAFLR